MQLSLVLGQQDIQVRVSSSKNKRFMFIYNPALKENNKIFRVFSSSTCTVHLHDPSLQRQQSPNFLMSPGIDSKE
jgi:hypothetical protein